MSMRVFTKYNNTRFSKISFRPFTLLCECWFNNQTMLLPFHFCNPTTCILYFTHSNIKTFSSFKRWVPGLGFYNYCTSFKSIFLFETLTGLFNFVQIHCFLFFSSASACLLYFRLLMLFLIFSCFFLPAAILLLISNFCYSAFSQHSYAFCSS